MMLIDITSNSIFWKLIDFKRVASLSSVSPLACLHPPQGYLDPPKNQKDSRIPYLFRARMLCA